MTEKNIRHRIWHITVFGTNHTHRGASFYLIPTKVLKKKNLPLYEFLLKVDDEIDEDKIPRRLYTDHADILSYFLGELDVTKEIIRGKYKHRIVRSTLIWFDY